MAKGKHQRRKQQWQVTVTLRPLCGGWTDEPECVVANEFVEADTFAEAREKVSMLELRTDVALPELPEVYRR